MTKTASQTDQKPSSETRTPTILSGIQPSGKLHLGNYFGAMRQHLRMQHEGDAFYFMANYHTLTSLNDGKELYQNTIDVALDYLALGLDPNRCTFFVQSDVPQVTELSWILGTLCPKSLMEKGVAYKEKVANGLAPNIGLFTYPILQAADILIYHSDLVPVGADQKQNVEITRDLATKFNNTYNGEYLRLPEPYIMKEVAIVPGVDGRKMSKSYGNAIDIYDEGKSLKKKVMSIQTDSTPLEEPKDPDKCNVYALIRLFADDDLAKEIADKYRAGGYGYGHAKKELLGLITDYFAGARERAEEVMEPIRSVTGIMRNFSLKTETK